jgi:choline dehydrogenase-like flavoprotein
VAGRSLAHRTEEPLPGWSPALLHTLADVFATLAPLSPETALRHAHLGAETLGTVADPDELRLLKLAVRSLEWPIATGLTGGRWAGFGTLSPADREHVLLRWATHPVPRLRTAFQALKRLGLFLAYADPGPDAAGNPFWPGIGYRRADPVASPPPTIAPLLVDRTGGDPLELEADVVIVGSGAGGGVVAARLAAAGRSVLVVEAGSYLPEAELPVDEATGMQRLYLDQGTTATSDLGIAIFAGSGLGGGTTVNWTTTIAPPDWLRAEWAAGHGLEGFDGPEAGDDIARLRAELGALPPSVIPPKDRAILDGAAALGWEAAPTERNAGPCTDCGACGFGCRRGAKRSGLRAHLAVAAAHGARVLADAPVDRVLVERGHAIGVVGRLRGRTTDDEAAPAGPSTPRGRPFRVRAGQVVVAAGALRTPLVLHASGIEHPQLGRNLRLHPVVAMAAELVEPVEMWLGPTQAARSLQFARGGGPDPDGPGPAHGGFIIESAPPHPGLIASAFPWEGRAASEALLGRARYHAPLLGIVRDAGSGHVHWTRHRRARIDYSLSPADRETARRALVELARLGRAAGAVRLIGVGTPAVRWAADGPPADWGRFLVALARADAGPNRISLFSAHQMGSARSGGDPAAHPCDPHGRVRADRRGRLVEHLYVADTSLFPTAAGVNPMLTAMALAERTVRAVLGDAR